MCCSFLSSQNIFFNYSLSLSLLSFSITAMESRLRFSVLCILFLSANASVSNKVTDNPSDQLVAAINTNRTSSKSSALYSNTGLACIALQYIKAYQGDCGAVGGPNGKKPADSEFAETFAPNCNVEASTLAPITGRLLGCQSTYVSPSLALTEILLKSNKSLGIVRSKNHTEVGAAVSGSGGGGPYFWCVLFSNGKSNSSFVLEGGEVKISRPGCFSGANDDCSGASDSLGIYRVWVIAATSLVALGYGFGV